MSLTISWSTESAGLPIGEPIVHGSGIAQGTATTPIDLFVRHNGDNPITDAGLYLSEFTGTYSGSADASTDYNELLEWGDASAEDDWGGVCLNMNKDGSFPASSNPTFSNKTSSDTYGENIRSGVGDNDTNRIQFPTVSGADALGTINSGNNSVQVRFFIQVPLNEDILGIRMFTTSLKYTFTS